VISVVRILVAPDKFKGSLVARDVADAIAAGNRDVLPDAEITALPVADGGEGTAEVICGAAGGEWRECDVHDPLGRDLTARYCTIANGATAVMEMSEASGLWRVPEHLRNPDTASSFGVGEMLLHAAQCGAQQIIIGLGGSATNDGGFGMARALGFRFFDAAGAQLTTTVTELLRLDRIERPGSLLMPPITAAVDVQTPLLGARGATLVFGAQKGASASQMEMLELALARLADIVARHLGVDARDAPGNGAAGGLGFGLVAFCGAAIRAGFEVVAQHIGLEEAVRAADIVITGEGRLDSQTLHGKAPAGIARLARRYGKRCYGVVGEVDSAADVRELFDDVAIARPANMSREEAIANARVLLRECSRRLAESFAQPRPAA
jgi:glycerate 2-kinase